MKKFERSFIDRVLIKENGQIIQNCKQYELFQSASHIGRFYSGDNFSFAEIGDLKIRFDKQINFFKQSDFHFFNQYTEALLGGFDIPNGFAYLGDGLHFAPSYKYLHHSYRI